MRCMNCNKRMFYYALYSSKTSNVDEYGNYTGEYAVTYGNPVLAKGNISAAQGEVSIRQFGEYENYDRVIVMDNPNTPINENAVLWIDTVPQLDSTGATTTPWDYVVKKVARGLNSVSIAVSKVKVG